MEKGSATGKCAGNDTVDKNLCGREVESPGIFLLEVHTEETGFQETGIGDTGNELEYGGSQAARTP